MKHCHIMLLLLLLTPIHFALANQQNYTNTIPLTTKTTWKSMRDNKVSKQDVDYSCGASSLSTILTYFYQHPKTEQQILDDMDLKDMMSSFQDLANVSERYGFIGRGILTDYQSLRKIKIPVIVYLNHKRNDHFSVVRAINDSHVYLSDSSWGNRILSKQQFEKMWLTSQSQGKALLILPKTDEQKQLADYQFVKIQHTYELLYQIPQLFTNFL